MARRDMKNERVGNTLQTTALVNEVYLRLVDVKNVDWQHQAQFFAIVEMSAAARTIGRAAETLRVI